jgi:hypothetical protein
MGDLSDVKMKLAGTVALDEGGEATINGLTDIVFTYVKSTADSMATDATAAVLAFVNPFDFAL